jgi:pyruvate/2-oxoglutarate/acetoin dehydrogenase E1 component
MDSAAIRASVRKTGRLVIADEAGPTAGASAEIATLVTEDPETFACLKAPVKRVCALQVPIPYSPGMEDYVFPDRHKIADAVRALLAF